jgi:hypothetical protein
MAAKQNPSKLPGSHRDRVFVGGSYAMNNLTLLGAIEKEVRGSGFVPIIAHNFQTPLPDRDIHDVTLWLLHACRLAVFEVSTLSGALMELERMGDYGIRKALLLYQHPGGLAWPTHPMAWRTTQMLKSLVVEQSERCTVRSYIRPKNALTEVRNFLRAIKRSAYGKLHGL